MVAILFVMTPFLVKAQSSKFVAPKSADVIQNPLKAIPGNLSDGKTLFTKYCVACHGNKGKGDGLAAASLNPKPADFLLPSVIKETDGSLFWKLSNGKTPMPAWGKILQPKQCWQLVLYIRTLEKK